jgi:hypothetical protein
MVTLLETEKAKQKNGNFTRKQKRQNKKMGEAISKVPL